MKNNIFDESSDELKRRLDAGKAELQSRFKGTKPYRKERVDPAEQLYEYNQITPEIEAHLRATMGDAVFENYQRKMEQIQRRYNG